MSRREADGLQSCGGTEGGARAVVAAPDGVAARQSRIYMYNLGREYYSALTDMSPLTWIPLLLVVATGNTEHLSSKTRFSQFPIYYILEDKSSEVVECDPNAIYRSPDGSCTNLKYPRKGSIGTPFTDLLPPDFDEKLICRKGIDGRPLPSGRSICLALFRRTPQPDPELSLAFVFWGQTLGHDISFTLGPETNEKTGERLECCPNGRPLFDTNCHGILIPKNDPYFLKRNITCLSVARGFYSVKLEEEDKEECAGRHQLNFATHPMDLSIVYGATQAAAAKLRGPLDTGHLYTSGDPNNRSGPDGRGVPRSFPPLISIHDSFSPCKLRKPGEICLAAGDFRVNQNLALAALHTVLIREHNRLATAFHQLNPGWSGERLYQEARRLLIAQYQHITYTHFLPYILDLDEMRRVAAVSHHDPFVSPTAFNSFVSGAFRALHTMIPSVLILRDETRSPLERLSFGKDFFRPGPLRFHGRLDLLVRALGSQAAEAASADVDPFITDGLFRDDIDGELGMDLPAFDIQRGRDVGVPSYNAFRRRCALQPLRTWKDADYVFGPGVGAELSALYANPEDVDLIVGGMLERRSGGPGPRLGPTLRCIAVEQFVGLKAGDRFFYEFTDGPHPFTSAQLEQIRKISVSRLLCDHADFVVRMQPDIFRVPSDSNPIMSCNDTRIERMDLSPWLDINGK